MAFFPFWVPERFFIRLGVCWWICSETPSAFFHPEGVAGSRRLDRGRSVAEALRCFLSSASGELFLLSSRDEMSSYDDMS